MSARRRIAGLAQRVRESEIETESELVREVLGALGQDRVLCKDAPRVALFARAFADFAGEWAEMALDAALRGVGPVEEQEIIESVAEELRELLETLEA